jgi:serine/threonine protein kinase
LTAIAVGRTIGRAGGAFRVSSFQPEVFGKYFLVDRIAVGGMAEIFKAKTFSHGGFEQILVIKRILSHLGDNEEFVEMFIDEAKVSVALQHANVIRIYDFGKILDNYFIAMEWVDGKDSRNLLKKLSKQRKFLPVEYAAYIAHEACKGLEYAHRKTDLQGRPYGIVHRDVSPSNILVSYEGDVKVADFGIAKAENNAYDTKDGVLKGKFEYMSPEQAEGVEIDSRSDIFSLGIIFHEMLTGRRLFKTSSETETLEKIKKGEYPTPSSIHSRVPPELDRIVMKALARNRDERYQSAKDMQDDLVAFLLPATTDQIRQRVARFMEETFAEEIAEERKRLEDNARVADTLRRSMPDSQWDGSTNTTMSQPSYQPQAQRSVVPWVVAGGLAIALMVVVGVVGLGGAAIFSQSQPEVVVKEVPVAGPPVEEKKPTTGTLDVLLLPGGKILLDGNEVGKDSATLADLAPGEHTVRVELDGYEPIEEKLTITAGQTTKFAKTLKAIPKPKSESKASVVKASARSSDSPPPASEPKSPGKVTITVMGGGWANVFVNGEKQAKTAPMTLELKPGTYSIRVQNPAIGVDQTQSVTVTSGGTAKVTAKPQ